MAGWKFQQRWTSLLDVLLVSFAFSGATPVEKRSHHSGPDWIQDCWDHAENHIMNPFCPQNVTHCPDPPQISGGTFTPPTSTIVGTTVVYTCDDHYAMFGDDSIKCVLSANETVAWTKTPSCQLVCGDAPDIDHGTFVTPDNSLVGTVVSYSCDEGYVFASEAHSIECLDGGTWGPGPECVPAPCTAPPTIDNGYTSGDDVILPGSTLTVHCDDMYKLQGTNTVTCLGSNNWSEPPVCEPKVCVAPPDLTHGFIVLTGSTNTPKTTQTPSEPSTSGAQQTTNAPPTSGPTQTPTSGLPMSSSSIKKSPQTTSVIPYYPKTTPSTSYGPFTSIPPHTNEGTQTVTTSPTTVPTSASEPTTTVKIVPSTAIIVDATTENVDVTSRASTSTPPPTNEGTKSSVTLTTSPMETTSTTNSIQTTTEESEVIFTSTQEPPLVVSTIDYATDSKTTEVEPARTTEFEPIGTTESELIQITSSFMTIPTTTTDEPELINPIEGGGSGEFDFTTTTTEDYNTTILYNMTTDSDIEYSENGTDEIIDNDSEGLETSGNETGETLVDNGLEGIETTENGTDEIIDHNGIETIETIQNATDGIIDTENGTSEIIDTGSEGLETSENGSNDTNGIEPTDNASSEGIEAIEEVFTTTTGTEDYNTTILYNQTTDGDGLIDTDYYEYYEYETFENETDEIGEMTDSDNGMTTTTTTEDYNTTILYNETTDGDLIDYYNYEYYYYYEYETVVNDTDEIGEIVDTWSEMGTNVTDIDNDETVRNDTDEIGESVDIGSETNVTDINNVEGNDGTDDTIGDIDNMEATNETDTTADMENVEATNEPDISEIEETTKETNTTREPSQDVTDTTEMMAGVLEATTLRPPPLKTEGTTMWNYFSPDDVPAADDIEVSDEVANEDTNMIGTIVQYTCNTGYSFKDPGTAVEAECVDNGGANPEWTQLPDCIPDCGTPADVNHSSTYYNSTLEGAVAEYRCDVGYVLNSGTGIVECPASGIWTPAPSCIPDCGAPAEISNGMVNYGNTTLGGLAAYQCKHGYKMVGLEVTTCLETSTWTQEPTCNIDCGPVPVVANAVANRVENTTLTYTYECVERFNMEGNNTIVCIDDGTEPKWTRVPYCECIRVPVDIIFILDGSGSVNIDGFNDTLRFVSDIISRFPVETTRFGMIVFSSYAVPEFHLGQFVNNTGAMVDHINNSTYPAGSTATYDALKYARTQMFQPVNGMRPNVSHAAIVVTDGQSDNFNETVLQAQLLRDVGVTIYSVGVGAYADHDELMAIASDDTYIFHVDEYSSIDQVAGPLADIACHAQHFRDEQIVMP